MFIYQLTPQMNMNIHEHERGPTTNLPPGLRVHVENNGRINQIRSVRPAAQIPVLRWADGVQTHSQRGLRAKTLLGARQTQPRHAACVMPCVCGAMRVEHRIPRISEFW